MAVALVLVAARSILCDVMMRESHMDERVTQEGVYKALDIDFLIARLLIGLHFSIDCSLLFC